MKKLILIFAILLGAGLTAMADTLPTFPGGETAVQEYIETHIQYPQPALDNGIEGIVTLQCVILTDGSIGQIKIVRMLDPDLEQEAIRVVKTMPAWTPAEKNGTPVESSVTIPVKFTLPDE